MALTGLSMTPKQFESLRKIVYERSGIYFQDSKKYVLESRLARRLEELEFDSFDQYLMFLTMGPYQQDEFQEMFNRITINETSFFRNEPQLDYFEKQFLPRLLEARKSAKSLRVWSSACSTGEEPYTIAIQLHRTLGVRLADWRVEILGTDISEKALTAAQNGRYVSYSMRSLNPLVLKRYFTEQNGYYQIDPTIQSMVRFELLNLKDALAARRFGVWDVIFCRNVMIYFDDAMKAHCAKMFYSQLVEDGMLFIGHSETLRNVTVPFEPVVLPQAFAYTKGSSNGNGHGNGHGAAS
jgi:chemotaxis protein methyltransferase CheR